MIEQTYHRFLTLTGEPGAAAMLTLADALQSNTQGAMTVKQAAGVLRVSERVVRDLVAREELGHHRVGNGRGQVRILPRDIEHYQQRSESAGFKHLYR